MEIGEVMANIKKLWLILTLVMITSFGILGLLGREIHEGAARPRARRQRGWHDVVNSCGYRYQPKGLAIGPHAAWLDLGPRRLSGA